MNILLVNPWIYDFAAFDLWAKPLGLLYIGSVLENHGYKIRLIDCMDRLHPALAHVKRNKKYGTGKFYAEEVEKPELYRTLPRKFKRYGLPLDCFEADLKRAPSPDCIVVTSMMTYWYPGVHHAIRIIKNIFPTVPVIVGGIYATLCADHARTFSGADYIIEGNGIIPVLKTVDTLCGIKRNYASLSTHPDNLPYPAYHCYPALDSISMITSLGCPYRCTYCASHVVQPHFLERNPAHVFKEILYSINTFGINHIAFYDDALLINAPNRFIPLAQKIIAHNVPVSFHTPNGLNVRCITPTIAKLLFRAHVKTIRLSFESAARHIQQRSSAKITTADLIKAARYLRNAGYTNRDIEVYLMVGLPTQTHQEVIDSLHFVHDCGLTIRLVQYSPIPHTADFLKAQKHDPHILQDPLYHNNSFYPLHMNETNHSDLYAMKNFVQELNALYQ